MSRVFAIGDIHGCCRTFRKLLLEELRATPSDEIYCIGDYIDRGPDSKGVIDFILELRKHNYKVHTLRGNHEQLLLDSSNGFREFQHWILNGGNITLRSFGLDSINDFHPVYLDFFTGTQFYIETAECVFAHAGLNFSIPDPFADKQAMLWTRDTDNPRGKLNAKILVHGHTPITLPEILPGLNKDVINIDGGCVYNYREGMGNLVALEVREKKFFWARNID